MTPAELFTRCGEFLCGLGPKWKEQFGTMLNVRTNTIDNMSKGTSRIPPGIWKEIEGLVDGRIDDLPKLKTLVHNAAVTAEQERSSMQTSVTNGPARAQTARYRISPAIVNAAFSPGIIGKMNQRIGELQARHEFKSFVLSPGDNGSARVEVPLGTATEVLEGFGLWIGELEKEFGYIINPYSQTGFQTNVGEPLPRPRR